MVHDREDMCIVFLNHSDNIIHMTAVIIHLIVYDLLYCTVGVGTFCGVGTF